MPESPDQKDRVAALDAEERAQQLVRKERARQQQRWTPEHDDGHSMSEWFGLIVHYATGYRWVQVAALAQAAIEADLRKWGEYRDA